MNAAIILLFIAFVAISYGVWRHNKRKLNKPKDRWKSFKDRTERERRQNENHSTK